MKFITTSLILLGAALTFSSCSKTESVEPEMVSALAVTNASATVPSLDFVIEGTKVNPSALLFGQKVDYVRAYPGTRTADVYATGVAKSLYNAKFDLTAGLYHSLYILASGQEVSYLLVKDEFKAPVQDKAQLRFANLSPDSPTYNLELEGDTTAFSDRAYKTLTPYKYVKPGIFKVLLRNKITNAVVVTLENVELKSNKYYTIWAKGLVTTDVEAQKLGIKVSQHFD